MSRVIEPRSPEWSAGLSVWSRQTGARSIEGKERRRKRKEKLASRLTSPGSPGSYVINDW